MTNLCGHDRNKLLCVLRWAAGDDTRGRTKTRCNCGGPCCVIYNNLIDPAKLAEMLAVRGRELGLSIGAYVGAWQWDGTYQTTWAIMPTWGHKQTLTIKHFTLLRGGEVTMSQARAILLQWLQLPNGAREEAGRVLRGDT